MRACGIMSDKHRTRSTVDSTCWIAKEDGKAHKASGALTSTRADIEAIMYCRESKDGRRSHRFRLNGNDGKVEMVIIDRSEWRSNYPTSNTLARKSCASSCV